MTRFSLLSTALLAAGTATAHFSVSQPDSHIGDSTSNQDDAPCGGFEPSDNDTITDFYVGGDAVALRDSHSQSEWVIHGSIDLDEDPDDWEQLFPTYQTRGAGSHCQPAVTAPEDWAGRSGIIAIVNDAPDGTLYACAAVNFVEGTGPDDRDGCSNSSDVQVSLADGDDDSNDDDDDDDDDSAANTLRGGMALAGLVAAGVAYAL